MEKKEKQESFFSMVVIALLEERFVRVDGLQYEMLILLDKQVIAKGAECVETPVIKWDSRNGKIAVVLPTGSVWLRANDGTAAEAMRHVRRASGTIPVIPGAHVPLSNQEDVSCHDLLRRFADPEWEPEYLMTGTAHEAGFGSR